jgi:hypothetical protein
VAVDQQILVAGQSAAPLSYTVPNAVESALLCVNATIDGTGASGAFYPTVEIVSDGGVVVARCPCFTSVAAGASAEVSWFRLRQSTTTTATTSAYNALIDTTPQILSHWTLNETSGTTFADTGPSNLPLAITGTPTLGNTPLITTGHSALFSGGLDGGGHAAQFAVSASGYGPAPNNGSQTVEAWVATSFSGATNPQIVCMDDAGFRFFQFRLSVGGKLQYITFDSSDVGNTTLNGATTINDGARHHVVGTADFATLTQKVYVDGVLDGTSPIVSLWAGTTPQVSIAARFVSPFGQTPIGATIDEVAVYSRALTATEVASHYTAGIT